MAQEGIEAWIRADWIEMRVNSDAGLLQQYITCLIDLSHATASNQANDTEAIGDLNHHRVKVKHWLLMSHDVFRLRRTVGKIRVGRG